MAITNAPEKFEHNRTKRGDARIEKYEGKEEPFGLNKRTRRVRKGAYAVTKHLQKAAE